MLLNQKNEKNLTWTVASFASKSSLDEALKSEQYFSLLETSASHRRPSLTRAKKS
jgi:hypothetical protein